MKERCIELVSAIYELLADSGMHITAAESCTGGRLAAAIVDLPGASDILDQALVTYSNDAKMRLLGVCRATLEKYGAVSEAVAAEMAAGAARNADCEVALSTTGIAGPAGGTPEKPVGLVYIGCYFCGDIAVRRFCFEGDRDAVRDQAVIEALKLGLDCIRQ